MSLRPELEVLEVLVLLPIRSVLLTGGVWTFSPLQITAGRLKQAPLVCVWVVAMATPESIHNTRRLLSGRVCMSARRSDVYEVSWRRMHLDLPLWVTGQCTHAHTRMCTCTHAHAHTRTHSCSTQCFISHTRDRIDSESF